MGLLKNLGLLTVFSTSVVASCTYNRVFNELPLSSIQEMDSQVVKFSLDSDFKRDNLDLERWTKRSLFCLDQSDLSLALLDEIKFDEGEFEWLFETREEIMLASPFNYHNNSITYKKGSLENRFLRPLKDYDESSPIVVDKLIGKEENFIRLPSNNYFLSSKLWGDEEVYLNEREQNMMLREILKFTFDWYKGTDSSFARELNRADEIVTNLTTFEGIKLDPKYSVHSGKWGLGLKTKVGPGKIEVRYEQGEYSNEESFSRSKDKRTERSLVFLNSYSF